MLRMKCRHQGTHSVGDAMSSDTRQSSHTIRRKLLCDEDGPSVLRLRWAGRQALKPCSGSVMLLQHTATSIGLASTTGPW